MALRQFSKSKQEKFKFLEFIQKAWTVYFNFVKRWIPEPEAKVFIGLDVGSSFYKMIVLSPEKGSFKVVKFAIHEIEEGKESTAIKALLAQCPARAYNPVVALSGKGTLVRYLELPRMSEDDFRKSFQYEADKHLPFSLDEIYTDFQILDPKSSAKKMTVMVAAAKRDLVSKELAAFEEAGVSIESLTVNHAAMANIVSHRGICDGVEGAVAVIDIGHDITGLNIYNEGLPYFTRDVAIGTKHIELADKKKEGNGKIDREMLAQLISEARLSFDYFVTEKNVALTKILVSGGGAVFPEVGKMFSEEFEISAEIWNPFSDFVLGEDIDQDQFVKQSPQFIVALGLALS